MGNLRVDLKKQRLKTNYKTEAENCMIILEKLKEIDGAGTWARYE